MKTIMRNQFRASYNYWINDGVLFLEDLNVGRSLTNDMEGALMDIEQTEQISVIDWPICYRDSEGIWDAVKYDGSTVDFIFLGAINSDEAKELLMEKFK